MDGSEVELVSVIEQTCCICVGLIGVSPTDQPEHGYIAFLKCKHIFHKLCIETSLAHKAECPLCRLKSKVKDVVSLPFLDLKTRPLSKSGAVEPAKLAEMKIQVKGLQSEVNSLTTLVNQTSTALNDRNFQYSMIQIDRDQLRNEHANRSQHHQAELARREREERDRIAVHSAERSKLEEIITRLKREAESRGMEVDALRTMVANAKAQLRDKVKSVKDHYEPQLLVLQNTVDSLSKRTCGCKEQVELAQKSERSLRRELESVRIELAGIKKKYVSGGNISKRGRSPSPDLILPGSSQIPKSSKFKTNLIGGSNRPVIASDGMGNLIKTRPSSSRVAPAPPVLTSFNMNTFSKKNGPSSSSASSSSNNKANNKISSYFRPIL